LNRAGAEEALQRAAEHEAAGRLEAAATELDTALAAAPDHAEALHLKGVVAAGLGDVAEGARCIERAIQLGPAEPRYFRNLCEVYRLLGRYDDALEAGRVGAAAAPDDPICHLNLSVLHQARGDPASAVVCAERALAIEPDLPGAHFGLAEGLLALGEFERGWDEYEWRFRLPGIPPLTPISGLATWDGTPVHGGLLVIADQGFGDSIQFSRYIPWAAERCDRLVLAASRELQPLLGQLPGVASMFDQWDMAPECSACCALSSLPRLHRTRLANVPAPVPYLRDDSARTKAWRSRLDSLASQRHRRIGLVWAGRPAHRNDALRSMTLADLAPLGALEDVTLISLQLGAARTQISGYFGRAPLINVGAAIGDFADTLSIISCLDLVISIDTSVAHLAGAAGKPVWIMLPHAADWRWLRSRADTPWYPTARLFRQRQAGTWSDVVGDVVEAIRTRSQP